MPTRFDVQRVIDQLLEVLSSVHQVNLVGIHYQQWRRIVVQKEFTVHLIKLFKVVTANRTLGCDSTAFYALE
jgi:hypothetical protein